MRYPSYALAAALLAGSSAAIAGSAVIIMSEPAPTARILVGDLDLASPDGKSLFTRRLNRALEKVCGSYLNAIEYSDERRVTNCRQTATDDASRQVAERRSEVRQAVVTTH